MDRITIRRDHGVLMAPGWDFGIDPDDYDLVQRVLDRLAAFEDIGLEPNEITKLAKENARLRKELKYARGERDVVTKRMIELEIERGAGK